MDLSQLSFGPPAAERDRSLRSYFIESHAFERLARGDKRIVLGNRGAGKSAIFQMIAEGEKRANNVVIELAPEDYSYQMFSDALVKEVEGAWLKSGAYAAAWKYLILVLVMKKLSKLNRGRAKSAHAEKMMFRYLADHHANVAEKPIDILLSYLRRMEGVKLGKYEAGTRTRELTRLYKLEEIEPYIPTTVSLCKKTRVSVLVDELDQGWDASEDAQAFVAGLFQACTSINRLAPNHLRIYVSLRQELYENIPSIYDDAQKYRDLFQSIHWDHEQLYLLLTSRIRHYIPELWNRSDDECWRSVFAEQRSFRYMLERSLYRPRELITYATEALECVRSHRRAIPLSHDTVTLVEHGYSQARMQDVVSEFRFQYPGLDSVFEHFRGKTVSWDRDRIEDLLIKISLGELPVHREARSWVIGSEPDRLLDVLWRVGLLRVDAADQDGGSDHVKSWVEGSAQDPSASLFSATRFRVHPLFRSALGVRTR